MAIEQENVNVNDEMLEHLSKFSGPIPGQSLTNSPDNPQPYERPATHSTLQEATYALFEMLTEDEMLTNVVVALSDGVPVTAITQVLLTDGFQKGAWNPDLMIMLIEPTMYMIMSLAEKTGIKYRIDEDDDPDADEATPDQELGMLSELMDVAQKKITNTDNISIPSNIKKELKSLPLPASLLGKVDLDTEPETEEVAEQETSILEQRG
mgnify:CR=1 FL=1